jgi:hypothetical protein
MARRAPSWPPTHRKAAPLSPQVGSVARRLRSSYERSSVMDSIRRWLLLKSQIFGAVSDACHNWLVNESLVDCFWKKLR